MVSQSLNFQTATFGQLNSKFVNKVPKNYSKIILKVWFNIERRKGSKTQIKKI